MSFQSHESPPLPFLGLKSQLGEGDLSSVPQPMVSLHETPIPPFLSKTYDLVDDPKLDSIICWGEKGDSFVVWDPIEFARMILPRNFKHSNFSSFVRQLNTYGFRKIDADKWEFMNGGFIRGQRHLLKYIQRRKSHQSQQNGNEDGKAVILEGEIGRLRKERSLMMQELVELQHYQRGTLQHVEIVNEKVEAAEKRQKQMVSFLAKMFKNPSVLAHHGKEREQKSISSHKSIRKFVKHCPHEKDTSSPSPKGQIVEYEPEPSNFTTMPFSISDSDQAYQDMGNNPFFGAENVPFRVEDTEMVNELNSTPERAEELVMETSIPQFSILGTESMATEDDDVWSMGMSNSTTGLYGNLCKYDMANELIGTPEGAEESVMETNIPQFSILGTESMATEEDDVWSMGMSNSTTGLYGNLCKYDVADLGAGSGLPDIWDIGLLQPAGSSGSEKWPDE
ncbi:hypothetical protein BUALT_Bualt09G0087700 [Buddleja alternifolia]|uniref:Heat stress transcription factor n=1 Tax=Buddleja alternifolia TaxID=168488 RepID=A0AAV6X2G5_9LAMI|nr:hypothetical protein BUALT_Bualt09G0087700 [Buddleja alternifolia]